MKGGPKIKLPVVLQPLRLPDFRLLAGGQFISMLGNQAYTVALAWQVQILNPSPEALSAVLICYSVSQLAFLLIGGALVDRLPRKTIMLASDIGRAALVLAVAWLGQQDRLEIWQLGALSAVNGAVAAFFMPALNSIQPYLVPKEKLQAANSLMALGFQTSLVTGPLLGAILVQYFAPPAAFAFDALTFAVSAFCLVFIRYTPTAAPDRPKRNLLEDVKAGFGYVRGSVWLWFTILLFGLLGLTLAGPVQALVAVLARENFQGEAEVFGLLLSARAVAAVAGTLLMGQLGQLKRRGIIAYLSTALAALGVAVLGLAGNAGILWVCVLGICGLGLGFACFDVIWITVLQEMVPAEYLGRVLSLDMLGSFCMIPLGLALSGMLASYWGAGTVMALGGLLSGLFVLLGLSVREIRSLN